MQGLPPLSPDALAELEKENALLVAQSSRAWVKSASTATAIENGAGVDGISWAQRQVDSPMPDIPVISILEFQFECGINVRNAESATRKRWDMILDSILAMPGCIG